MSPERGDSGKIEMTEDEHKNFSQFQESLQDRVLEKYFCLFVFVLLIYSDRLVAPRRRHSERPTNRSGRRSAPIGVNLLSSPEPTKVRHVLSFYFFIVHSLFSFKKIV